MMHFIKIIDMEEQRKKFVKHSGKKTIIVGILENEINFKDEKHLSLLLASINKHTQNTEIFMPHFTTTSMPEKISNIICVLSAFKEYYDYLFITMCGLTDVTLTGTLQDWQTLLEAAHNLAKFIDDDNFTTYIKNLLPVLNELIDAKMGIVNLDFWNSIIHLNKAHGSGIADHYTGWITKFYGESQLDIQTHYSTECIIYHMDIHGEQHFYNVQTSVAGFTFKDGQVEPKISLTVE